MTFSKSVLCVITNDQYREYESELALLNRVGAELMVESSPELALSLMGQVTPCLVIVGMNLGDMEGLEFLAMVMRRYPQFEKPVILLPEKEDGLPPVIHSRTQLSGRSAVEAVDFEYIAKLVVETQEADLADALEPSETPGPAYEAEPLENVSVTGAFEALVPTSAAGGAAAQSSRAKWVVPAIAGAVLVVAAMVVYFILGTGTVGKPESKTDAIRPVAGDSAVNAAKDAGVPAEIAKAIEQPLPKEAVAVAQPEESTLPLRFDAASGTPQITDSEKLDEIVRHLQEHRELQIEITGHTSSDGETENNYTLGTVRAAAAMKILVRRGVSPQRVVLKSIGDREPVASNASDEGRAQNRRVTVRLVP